MPSSPESCLWSDVAGVQAIWDWGWLGSGVSGVTDGWAKDIWG